ncbi:beta-glucosidase [Bacteroides reticulotermitis JCM 10512]|uniref:beta-glucosidase n=2 Tax=Bacteroides reticulotermitis TaxID=1133319 RepID=W4UMW2_9BACE|nr:beta-glucosidase [Bacteroides reticulotermitis JCM 10512]
MDAKLPVDKRVEALLGQMTLKEKIGQMDMVTVWDREAIFKNGYYDFGAWLADLEPEESNQLQKLSEQTRLKIPYLIGMDAAHGYAMLTGRTVFPTSISMAATFNRELVLRTTTKAGEEIRSAGTHWAFAPCIDIVQDARWGRTGETYGEDPFLTSELVKEAVRGYQGNEDPLKRVAVSVKHLVGGGASVGGCNHASAELSERALRSYFLPPFKAAIEAGCMTIMPGHNDIAGVPVHASKWLLTDLIKKEYDFKGFFISDMGDVGNLAASLHQVAENQKEAIRMSINAGLDMHMYSADSMRFVAPLIELVQEKKVSQERIDDAVRRILKIKFELGLFENRYVSPEKDNYGSKENKDLALEAAREAIVLLKNKQQILPLDKNKYKKILVTGPNADNQSILGDWSIFQPDDHVTTILEGIQTLASPEQSITYSNSGRIKLRSPICRSTPQILLSSKG